MGFSSSTFTTLDYSPLKSLQQFIFTNIVSKTISHTISSSDELHPSPSSVPLPIHLTTKSHKNNLPMVQYNHDEDEGDSCCTVCLSMIEPCHNIRKLGNCEHAFHAECIDSWMDVGHDTCPVCRARLFAGDGEEEVAAGQDPWRSERMVYLFGEDCLMEELR